MHVSASVFFLLISIIYGSSVVPQNFTSSMRYAILSIVFLALYSCDTSDPDQIQFADNPVIAHRGAWKTQGHPQNSIASLREAIALQCAGSEFDVRMTADDVLIVTHDKDYADLLVEESSYAELAQYLLPNDEVLPTLEDYILAGMKDNSTTGLVCEIKPSATAGRNEEMAAAVIALVERLGAEKYMSYYISFSHKILMEIERLSPTARTLYLDGSIAPERLKIAGLTGLDYHIAKYRKKPHWIYEAKSQDLVLNAWTVNDTADIDWLLKNDFDLITTDEPELARERAARYQTTDDWPLVWADEFDYEGAPDPEKWGYETGFIRNQEDQYYTDSLRNSRVEDGHLILETHRERMINAAYKNDNVKSWKQNRSHAEYTAASLTTKDLAEWQYARIDIKAKLPAGRGLWPAFWMLGANWKEVGWPKCGEIDIMEHVGYEPDNIFGTIHTESYNHMRGTQKGKDIFINNPYDSFHVYSLIWTPETMDFLLDDVVYNSIPNEHLTEAEWPFDQKFHLKINVAVGGMLGGREGIDDSAFPNQMIIDYVRVYQAEL